MILEVLSLSVSRVVVSMYDIYSATSAHPEVIISAVELLRHTVLNSLKLAPFSAPTSTPLRVVASINEDI